MGSYVPVLSELPNPTQPTLSLDSLAAAIEREENVNPAKNNPGAITSGGVVATYPTTQAGQSALINQLQRATSGASPYYSPSESLEQFEETYTGGDLNAGSNVASFLGVPSTTPMSSFTNVPSNQPSAPSATGSPSLWSQALNYILNPTQAGVDAANAMGAGSPVGGSTSKYSIVDGIVVVVGLILLAGAVFGFKNIQDTVVSGVRTGAGAARDAVVLA